METASEWGMSFLLCVFITLIAAICIGYCLFKMFHYLAKSLINFDLNYIY